MTRKRTLLAFFAHPDDETFGPGATFARYAAEGVDVHIVIATDGIAGSVEDPQHVKDHETLAQVRSAELANAAIVLGVRTIWSMPYRDSGMRGSPDNDHRDALIQQPLELLTADVLEYIRRLRPDVVLTHDPFGGYGHPDHIRVCEATTAAFHIAAHTDGNQPGPQKLYYTAYDRRFMPQVIDALTRDGLDPTALGRNKDIDLVELSRWETPIHARIDVHDYLDYKERASRAHVSQYSGGPFFLRYLPEQLRIELASTDSFTRAYPAPDSEIERDLFADTV